jgi:hypothetical protein
MGFTPRQMQRMSLWEYGACLDGWKQAHEIKKEEEDGMTPELFRAIMDAPVKGMVH